MSKPKLYAALILVVLLALVGSACVAEAPAPAPPVAPEANFRFLISDEPNAIDDFEHLYVTISEIGFRQGGESGNWTEVTPDVTKVDLKPLVGDNALEIWSGNITPGDYSKVFIYVSDVEGILKGASDNATENETANVKLPSGKLQISKPFTVGEDGITSFVYDITVIKAGKSGMYILKPQIADSGADKQFKEVDRERKEDEEDDEERENNGQEAEIEGIIETMDGAVWTVRTDEQSWTVNVTDAEIEGEPGIGLLAEIEGTKVDGLIQASEVEIKEAEEGERSAGLDISCDEFAGEKHIQREIEVAAGEEFSISLCSNPGTGFQWTEAQIDDAAVLEEVSRGYVPPQGDQAGAPGEEVWVFKALQAGETVISMEYSQPWEGGTKQEWTFTLTVEVE